ncbi:ChbG/HpnK family deacetylase [bacterium]|nr:ChbG/HpnK family deacetylase [bacterium]
MKKLCFVADDFGLTKSVNQAILDAYLAGNIQGIALIVMADETEEAVRMIKEHNINNVGIHTSLFSFRKADRKQRADFIEFFRTASDEEVKKAVYDEFALYESLIGKKPEFIAPQWNMHGNLRVLRYVSEYALQHNIPVRIPRAVLVVEEVNDRNYSAEIYLKRAKVRMPTHLFAHILGSDATAIKEAFLSELSEVKDGESVECIVHPGYMDQDILELSSMNYERLRDMEIISDENFKQKIKGLGFEFTSYSEL